ncbi:MAG TPA: hypothetical protein VF699_12815 [Caulobacteraceae bacterium]|jgi:hypothetical protein
MRRAGTLVILLLGGCASVPPPPHPADAFFARLTALCGRTFEGSVVADTPTPSPDFAGKRLVMHVRDCTPTQVRIPFHVGEDRSRTWVVTRTPGGLRLKHDHRHEDGRSDERTNYGGDTAAPGTAARQEFPADAESKAMFVAQNIPVSVDNVWAIEVRPGAAFVYELARPNRLFRVEFDLTRPVTSPG